ncbi:MAG: glycosyltransferase [Endomicrobium sp.]|jgi:glycosyltransferase involved in cell wall biosynthesis|nr:glycosyltransferase [Endomicrobium sp.]
MKKNLLLTINIITYNHERYIAKCLDSILAQKTDFDFIVRIFEDCSTDKTLHICREYESKYPDRVFLYAAEKNLDVTLNSLRSYDNIKTPYYMLIEGDDFVSEYISRFQEQVDALEKHPECSFSAGRSKIYCDFYAEYRRGSPLLDQSGLYTLGSLIENPRTYFFSA